MLLSRCCDFGGANNFFVSGGFTAGLIYGASATKVTISNLRIGASDSVIVQGTSNTITNTVSAEPMRLAGAGHKIDCEVPNWSITDNSTGSMVEQRLVAYTPSWTASGTAPSIGNGSITGYYTRSGALVTAYITLSYGTTTTGGTGSWRFSLPLDDYQYVVHESGTGHTSGGTINFIIVPQVSPGNQYVTLFTTNGSDALSNLGDASTTWGTSTVIRFSVQYFTN